jgi:histone H1/5
LRAALKKGVTEGTLVMVKASYKLSAEAKKPAPKPKAKKAAAPKEKKAAAPKEKKATTKKVSRIRSCLLVDLVVIEMVC